MTECAFRRYKHDLQFANCDRQTESLKENYSIDDDFIETEIIGFGKHRSSFAM